MMDTELLIRCSMLHTIMSDPATKEKRESGELSNGAKTHITNLFKQNLIKELGFDSRIGFSGSKYTEKGLIMEDAAIAASSMVRARKFTKNTERLNNGYISGECDIYDVKSRRIIDTKCTYGIETHPFFQADAEKKVIESGYDWQMQGYMWLYDCDVAEVDFWLLPMPENMIKEYDNRELMVDVIEKIPLIKRVTTVRINKSAVAIKKIERKVEAAKEFYKSLVLEFEGKKPLSSTSKEVVSEVAEVVDEVVKEVHLSDEPKQKNRKVVLL